ncbi:MAG: hypothetical protein ACI4AK_02890 [Lepagella sp.]
MKHIWVLAFVALLLCECSKDDTSNYSDVWSGFYEKHFTGASENFKWTEYGDYFGYMDWTHSIKEGEFVEFSDLVDNSITIKTGSEETKYFDLADVADGKIRKTLLCPYSPYFLYKETSVELELSQNTDGYYTYFTGKKYLDNEIGVEITGKIYKNNLIIHRDIYGPLYLERSFTWYNDCDVNSNDNHIRKTLSAHMICSAYKFDTSSMKCSQSPILMDMESSSWAKEDISNLIAKPEDFFQLLMAMPILKASDFGVMQSSTFDYISTERLFRALFCCIYKKAIDIDYEYCSITGDGHYQNYPTNTFAIIAKLNSDNAKVCVDASKLFGSIGSERAKLFAQLIDILIPENECYFEMDYSLTKGSNRELTLYLKDEEASQKILAEIILPLMIQNRQKIKEYISCEPRLSAHSKTLCEAVDRLEDIFESTTRLRLGYKMVESASEFLNSQEAAEAIWQTDEFE